MYNDIGLSSARGTGTNGFVKRNMSHLKPRAQIQSSQQALSQKPPNEAILAHEKRRAIHLKCVKLEEMLRNKGTSDDDIKAPACLFSATPNSSCNAFMLI
jgi:serine/arginine repetitive matrix protein 2